MKFLLVGINSKFIHSNLAIHCLYSYAKQFHDDVEIKEYTINMPVSEIIKGIYMETPDFIGFSAYIWNIDYVLQVVRDIKLLLPNVIIYLGGPEVSYRCEEVLNNYREIDGIMIGEGEETFADLIKYYDNYQEGSLIGISGLCFLDNTTNQLIYTESRKPINLSEVPFPYRDLEDFSNRIIYYETSRGCPFGCSYCLSSIDKIVRFRDISMVKEELLFFLNAKVPQVKLVDRTFNINPQRSMEILSFIKENDNMITNFHFEVAGDILTEEEVNMINSLRPGLVQLEIGVQSTNEVTLKSINRHTNLEKLAVNVDKLLSGGKVHLHLDLIAGLPYEDLESFKRSFNEVHSMNSHELQLGFLKVLSGSPISQDVAQQQIQYSKHAPYEVLSTKFISYEDICELKLVEEMLEIYHNSCQFERSLEFLLSKSNSPYELYLGIAKYYAKRGQLIIQCKRLARYQLLLEFAIDKYKLRESDINKFRLLLTLDYYGRDRAKARPDFAPDISNFKYAIRKIEDNFKEKNPQVQYHIEPMDYLSYALFDYSKRSPITDNVIIEYGYF